MYSSLSSSLDYCNSINHLFLAFQVLLGSHNRFVCQTQTSIHNQEHTQNLFITTAHTTRVKADDPVCANPQLSLSTHTTNAHTCAPPSARSHTQSIYTSCHDHTILGGQNSKRTLNDSLLLQLLVCPSLPPSISMPKMFNAENTNSFHTKSSSAVHNHRSAASYSAALI